MNPVCFPFTDDTGKEMRDLMSRQTELLAAIAAGNASADFIDASFCACWTARTPQRCFGFGGQWLPRQARQSMSFCAAGLP